MQKIILHCLLLSSLMCTASVAQDLGAGLEEALMRTATIPLPKAIDPFITLALEADTVALAGLEIGVNIKEKEILDAMLSATRPEELRLRKRHRALRAIKSKLNQIKRDRELEARKAEEDGWDPFYAVFKAQPLQVPGTSRFELLRDGDEANEPFSAIVRPVFGGSGTSLVPVTAASFEATLSPSSTAGQLDISIAGFQLDIESFEIANGLSTGPNRGRLFESSSGQRGTIDPATGRFEFAFEGAFTNDLHDASAPIVFFVLASGILNTASGEVTIVADDPMLVPVPSERAVLGEPSLGAAAIMSFDQQTRTVRFEDNLGDGESPDVAMVRYSDGTYAARRTAEPLIGARLVIQPLRIRSDDGSRRFVFENSGVEFRVGTDVRFTGELVEPTIDGSSGQFLADLVPSSTNAGASRFLGEFGGPIRVQLATGVGVFDLLALTEDFRVSGRMPYVDLMHITGTPATSGPNPIVIGLVVAALIALVIYLIRRRP